ncbi:site-specific integrase [Eubacterium sp. 1001713B170207_170306_E7]|uniref:site-specific integrase n=1 Tax=Eubacterium sp. 1001713B170207_170306_E7 TaxID=2787097 RepID=UPI00189B108B|nr:site-specific integrase [Eubacterium sp. 1001713B170207_170306_E7]
MKKDISFEAWLQKRSPKVKGSTLKTYKSYERAHLLPFFATLMLGEITVKKQKQFKKWLRKKLSAKTARDILSYLRTILKEAARKGYPATFKKQKIKVVQKEKEILTHQQHQTLSHQLRQSIAPQDMGILLSMSTGLRLGEVLGLRQKDVDVEAGVLRVRLNRQRVYNPKTGSYPVVCQSPKTIKSQRDIPLHPALQKALASYLKRQSVQDQNQPLIAAAPGRACDASSLQRRFSQIKSRMGLSSGLTFHSLRHSFVARALELGADMHTVSEILGHSNVAFTLSVYGHCVSEQKRLQMEKMAKCF